MCVRAQATTAWLTLFLFHSNGQGVPSRELFEHFLLAVRPYFYPVGKPEEERRQAEHALYLFCLHNITDSFAPKPTDNEVTPAALLLFHHSARQR